MIVLVVVKQTLLFVMEVVDTPTTTAATTGGCCSSSLGMSFASAWSSLSSERTNRLPGCARQSIRQAARPAKGAPEIIGDPLSWMASATIAANNQMSGQTTVSFLSPSDVDEVRRRASRSRTSYQSTLHLWRTNRRADN